jgi:MOSC domain-containing protein YiiM
MKEAAKEREMTKQGKIVAVSVSERKGERKRPVDVVTLQEEHGIVGDAHAGSWHRQVSLLATESIARMQALGLDVDSGDFAENFTTAGLCLPTLPLGTRLTIGAVELEVTQIGKECHTRCAIFHQAGDCVMPKEGIFARVLRGGSVKAGDAIKVVA